MINHINSIEKGFDNNFVKAFFMIYNRQDVCSTFTCGVLMHLARSVQNALSHQHDHHQM